MRKSETINLEWVPWPNYLIFGGKKAKYCFFRILRFLRRGLGIGVRDPDQIEGHNFVFLYVLVKKFAKIKNRKNLKFSS